MNDHLREAAIPERAPRLSSPNRRRGVAALKIGAWNIGLLLLGVIGLALAGEAWLRLTKPFMFGGSTKWFAEGVGQLFLPGSETRATDGRHFWTVSTVNALGFVDRPVPPGPQPGCHVTVIGDSFVTARQVAHADKLHVVLETEAAKALPHLGITTSAFGVPGTGQVAQLAFYDNYARPLAPRVLVLVFVGNDFADNSPTLKALSIRSMTAGPGRSRGGGDPQRQPWVAAYPDQAGGFALRPPDPDYRRGRGGAYPQRATFLGTYLGWMPEGLHQSAVRLIRKSWFVKSLRLRLRASEEAERSATWDLLDLRPDARQWPDYQRLLEARPITEVDLIGRAFAADALAPIYEEALALTGFGLDQFKTRVERDGVRLLILATHHMRRYGERPFARLTALAAARDVPVIDQHAYIVRQGAEPFADANWPSDWHWNEAGHRWAGQAMLEYLARNEEVCLPADRAPGAEPAQPTRS